MKCRWCEEPIPDGERYCDLLCMKLYENRQAQQGQAERIASQKQQVKSHKNKVRSG
jgi:predicted nucleic acid-binding Zn ribbon protein